MLSSGRQKWLQLLESINTRVAAVAGGVAMAAAFATYLGPYSFNFRRDMLTVHWPQCLDERGVMLVVDSSSPHGGAEMFMMEQLRTVRSAKLTEGGQETAEAQLQENAEDEGKEQENENNGKIYVNFLSNKANLNVATLHDKKLFFKGHLDFSWNQLVPIAITGATLIHTRIGYFGM